ncbi:3D domain-containing protein [Sporomusa acidovorans]|uniref:3D domain-containing protein n=1 Tax=Sporomusa acidovorans (strain ATCC 49682 / DSM 3132 / Mol) TaxID=1123286 RepID=A0ABZ3IYY4_SPOA4|nr:3D domain-containing protein [Sporomusa acidovorans]OZC18296.1 cell wall-binding protein YocH precursor [Sporomusa acidovorans DSM 3132]SDF20740.1 3D (Asp-Asp-Asp) domain-containing protein [Sporomusa acidovorans]
MKTKHHCKTKWHFKKIAAALGSAVVLAAAAIPGVTAITSNHDATTPVPPAPAQEAAAPQPPEQVAQAAPPEEAGAVKVLDITATAYAPGPHDNDQWGNKTHLGTQVRPGVIAVDPRVIPLGSRVMIKYPDGSKEYAVAEDTGGAIKGHRIDIAKWTVKEAYRFGIKPVKVYVLNTPAQQNEAPA